MQGHPQVGEHMRSSDTPDEVLAFWREAGPSHWFRKDESFDRRFRERFLAAHEAAAAGQLDEWAADAQGALALLILLDQFPRNAFRDTARMFATDEKARDVARQSVNAGYDRGGLADLRNFFYLPFMHSEERTDQLLGERLASELGEDALKWARIHREIIERFGRFPHRNALLGRASTSGEQAFLDAGGFAG